MIRTYAGETLIHDSTTLIAGAKTRPWGVCPNRAAPRTKLRELSKAQRIPKEARCPGQRIRRIRCSFQPPNVNSLRGTLVAQRRQVNIGKFWRAGISREHTWKPLKKDNAGHPTFAKDV
jgi:hypothetical protein